MRYTPVELRHVRLDRALFGGYKRAEADALLSDVADSFEDVWRERGELADRLEDVEKVLDEVRQRESLLASTLIAAERTAAEAVESAKREAEVIVAEAHHESRSITRAAQGERDRLFAESRRVEALLRAALGIVEERHHGDPPADEAGEEDAPSWPNRENTTEFEAISMEDVQPESDQSTEPAAVQHGAEEARADDDIPRSGRDFVWG
ncbi:MAG TPA: DivIVA domain-containing protein [Gaiellaceae bacterium]|nr:DivIVA domain-containing protein [Gaiellaceae bacterium]